jgi:hypothetical protein
MKNYAVLTGDLIGSRELSPARLEAAMALIRRLADEFAALHTGALVGRPDVFRGDSWQACLQVPALAVTSAVFFRAGLKAEELDCRIGIGIGAVATLHPDRISESTGPVFVASGDALDTLPKDRALGFKYAGESAPVWAEALRELIAPLLDVQLAGWSQRESAAVYGTLRSLTQNEIAELPSARTRDGHPPTRQAVHDALRRIAWSSHVEPVLAGILKLISAHVAR